MSTEQEQAAQGPKPHVRPTFSAVLPDGALMEAVFRPKERETRFVLWREGESREELSVFTNGERLVPYSAHNNLLTHGVVLLPSGPEEYGTEAELLEAVRAHVHRYVDVSPAFEELAAYYVLLTWIYDGFNELPYLRVRGDPGCGKTRFLLTVGPLCYKPIFASGASTVSPVFRILDAVRGTLIMDESDFRLSDEHAEVVKILNNGNARGFPVLRTEVNNRREYDPRAYSVFGPKIVATRGFFQDRALESRFLTEDLGRTGVRDDIPLSLPPEAERDALSLRNKLLLFRFRNYGSRVVTREAADPGLEPRLNQVFGPLWTIAGEGSARANLRDLMRRLNSQQIADRGMDTEAHVLEVIRDLFGSSQGPVTIKDVTQWMVDRHASEYDRVITARWIGYVVRRKLLLKAEKRHGVFVIPSSERPALSQLFARYGIAPSSSVAAS